MRWRSMGEERVRSLCLAYWYIPHQCYRDSTCDEMWRQCRIVLASGRSIGEKSGVVVFQLVVCNH